MINLVDMSDEQLIKISNNRDIIIFVPSAYFEYMPQVVGVLVIETDESFLLWPYQSKVLATVIENARKVITYDGPYIDIPYIEGYFIPKRKESKLIDKKKLISLVDSLRARCKTSRLWYPFEEVARTNLPDLDIYPHKLSVLKSLEIAEKLNLVRSDIDIIKQLYNLHMAGCILPPASKPRSEVKKSEEKHLKQRNDIKLDSQNIESLRISKELPYNRLKKLLRVEKERRGKSQKDILFVGIADASEFYWCSMKSLLRIKNNELMFFRCYLDDRILYSRELGLLGDNIPQDDNELLSIGSGITLEHIQTLIEKRKKVIDSKANESISKENLKDETKRIYEHLSDDPYSRGNALESLCAKQLPKLRWNFELGGFIFVGLPDGIGDVYAYEFKSTSNLFMKSFMKPCAIAQANLYANMFHLEKYQLEILTKDKGTECVDGQVSVDDAERLAKSISDVIHGERHIKPKPFKCGSCEFNMDCSLRD